MANDAHPDRTVHGRTAFDLEIVRYDKASKWYVEDPTGATKRRQVNISEAAELAAAGSAPLGRYGGANFDKKVIEFRQARA